MSSPYLCASCVRRLAEFQGIIFRNYSSLSRPAARHEGFGVFPRRRGAHICPEPYGSDRNDRRGKVRSYHGVRKSSDDKVLESLFSSNLKTGETSTRFRYSRTPIIRPQSLAASEFQNDNVTELEQIPISASFSMASTPMSSENVIHQPPKASGLDVYEPSEAQEIKAAPPSVDQLSIHKHPKALRKPAASSAGTRKSAKEKQDMVAIFMNTIDKAVAMSNTKDAVQVWTRAKHFLDQKHQLRDPAKLDVLFTKLLSAFFQLRRAETAIDVWNYMIQSGYKTSIFHWNAMLHGCINGRDAPSLKAIWANISQSADTIMWTTYISGLIKFRPWEEGIEALNQLGIIWKSNAENKKVRRHKVTSPEADVARRNLAPTLAPVRAALDALIDVERYDMIPAVLGWASNHGLQPDTHTYNIILRPIARTGNLKAMKSHLTRMSANNCQPDISTFTSILSSLVSSPESNFHSLTLEEKKSTILSLLNDMRAADVPPNEYTYSVLLSAILKPPPSIKNQPGPPNTEFLATHNTNTALAQSLLTDMHANSVPPTPHIYTILFTYYFLSPTPNLPAIHRLWKTMQSSNTTPDPIFYDHMIEGLARTGQAEESLKFVKLTAKDGKSPSWVALGRCLNALVEEGKQDGVKWLVNEVEREGGLLRWGVRELRGRGAWGRCVTQLRRKGGWLQEPEAEGQLDK